MPALQRTINEIIDRLAQIDIPNKTHGRKEVSINGLPKHTFQK